MSASSKRGRTHEEIARILVDAETFGIATAAEMNGCHRNTVRNLRDEWGSDARVVRCCARLREEASKGWVSKARVARERLLDNVLRLAARSKNLRSTTEAMRRVGELVMASEIINPESEGAGAEPHDPHQPQDPRPPQGKAGRRRKGTSH